jgi:hypothetical protein
MQIKMTMKFHLTPIKMAIIKKTMNVGEDEGWGKEHLYVVVEMLINEATEEISM